jgi:DtxR family Mn-dependent transcriptional regulator
MAAINQSVLDDAEKKIQLNQVRQNLWVIVNHVDADIKATQRLSGLGIVPGTPIRVLSEAPFHGPVQIEVRGTRLVLGQGLAQKIKVRMGVN